MNVIIQETDNCLTALLEGHLDTVASVQAEMDMKPLFDFEGEQMIIDCTNLDYISSSGLRIFLKLLKHTKTKNTKLYIRGMNDNLRNVFTMTGFFHLFEFKN